MQEIQNSPKDSKSVSPKNMGLAAALMAFGTLTSRVLGLLRDMLLAQYFDRTVTDAWLVALRVPNLFRRILGEGAFAMAIVPILVKEQEKSSLAAQQTRDGLFLFLNIALIVTLGVSYLFVEELVGFLTSGSGYTAVEGKVELTVVYSRIMLWFLLFISYFAFAMSLLNAKKIFGPPGFAPALLNIAIIASVFWPSHWIGGGEALPLAYGVVAGGFLQALFLWFYLYKYSIVPRPRWVWSPPIKTALVNMGPAVVSMGLIQVTGLVNVYFASRLNEGAHTWIYLADRLVELPMSLIAVSIGSVMLPNLSQLISQGQREQFHTELWQGVKANMFLLIPASLALALLAEPLVTLLFSRGQFSEADVEGTTAVLKVYAVTLLTSGFIRVFVPGFYATGDIRFPAITSLVSLILHILIAPKLLAAYGIVGLVFSTSFTSVLQCFILQGRYHLKIHRLRWTDYQQFLDFLPATGAIALFMYLNPIPSLFSSSNAFLIIPTLILVVAIYFLTSWFTGVPETDQVVRKILKKLKR